jgi:2-(1,2-epoxy-1,2-dihydrophenyl)acetyl-CoA isomerase
MTTAHSEEQPLLAELTDGVLRLTFNRPHARNAMNGALRGQLRDRLATDATAPEVRAVVIRGDDRAFCSGGDIKEMGGGPATVARKLDEGRSIVESIARLPKPVIAAVRGHASGAGFSIAMACDLIVADETAVFRSVFIHRGLIPDLAGTYWLARQVGLYRAKEIIFSGRPVPAQEARDLGLVAHLWPSPEFDRQVDDLARRLAEGPTVAYGVAKRLLNRTFETDLSTALELEQLGQSVTSGSEDHRNSIEAFKNKTPATFRGR